MDNGHELGIQICNALGISSDVVTSITIDIDAMKTPVLSINVIPLRLLGNDKLGAVDWKLLLGSNITLIESDDLLSSVLRNEIDFLKGQGKDAIPFEEIEKHLA